MERRYLLVEVETFKDVPGLAEKLAGRAWSLEGVSKTTAVPLTSDKALRAVLVELEMLRRA